MLGQFTLSVPCSYDFIVSAFILDQPKHFRSSTKDLVLYSQDLDPVGEPDELVRDHLPENFMGEPIFLSPCPLPITNCSSINLAPA
jgi:hypothetical protein